MDTKTKKKKALSQIKVLSHKKNVSRISTISQSNKNKEFNDYE